MYLYLAVAGVMVTVVYIALIPRSPVVTLLLARPLQYLGRISYGLYVYHLMLIAYTPVILERLGIPGDRWSVQVVFALAFTTIAASVSYFLFERTALEIKDRFCLRHLESRVIRASRDIPHPTRRRRGKFQPRLNCGIR